MAEGLEAQQRLEDKGRFTSTSGGVAKRGVAVVVPIPRVELEADERWSLERTRRLLCRNDLVSLAPEGLSLDSAWDADARFDRSWFASRASYSRLLLSRAFYSRFADYEWILIVQLDVLLLGGELSTFLEMPWDYIGAPWLRDPGRPAAGFARVGNGGFSLRRVSAFRSVLEGRGRPGAAVLFGVLCGLGAPDIGRCALRRRVRLVRELSCGVERYLSGYSLNEDRFWSDRAGLFDRRFKVAKVADGHRFAFEQAPRLAYEQNGRQLPLGCHAWSTYDEEFWREKLGSELPTRERAQPVRRGVRTADT